MVGDLVSHNEVPIQIIFVGNGYANYEDEEGGPCQLDDKYYPPEPIPLTPEILEKNGWKELNIGTNTKTVIILSNVVYLICEEELTG